MEDTVGQLAFMDILTMYIMLILVQAIVSSVFGYGVIVYSLTHLLITSN